MRALTPLELAGLTKLVTEPGFTADADDDSYDAAWWACVDRGLATHHVEGDYDVYETTELGRLAWRVSRHAGAHP